MNDETTQEEPVASDGRVWVALDRDNNAVCPFCGATTSVRLLELWWKKVDRDRIAPSVQEFRTVAGCDHAAAHATLGQTHENHWRGGVNFTRPSAGVTIQ